MRNTLIQRNIADILPGLAYGCGVVIHTESRNQILSSSVPHHWGLQCCSRCLLVRKSGIDFLYTITFTPHLLHWHESGLVDGSNLTISIL